MFHMCGVRKNQHGGFTSKVIDCIRVDFNDLLTENKWNL